MKTLRSLLWNLKKIGRRSNIILYSTEQEDIEKEKELKRIAENASIDEPPTTCCMSGCPNCVYIAWAEAITAKMEDSGPEVAKRIMEKVQDPSMRAYIELELKIRGLKK